ncbi:MAG: CopG family ribbon-helix-helix protein [Desulfurivibrionaceae bacterium]
MNETILVSTRVSTDLAERLAALAQTTHRSKSFLAAQAIEEFLNVQEWQVKAIKDGLAAAERGDLKSHEQAIAILNTWGNNAKA